MNDFFTTEEADKPSVMMLAMFADTLTTFNRMLVVAFIGLVIQSDHMAGDTGEVVMDKATSASEAYTEQAQAFVDIINDRPEKGEGFTKDTYWKAMFHIQHNILPAVLMVEEAYGTQAPRLEGVLYSQAVKDFITAVV